MTKEIFKFLRTYSTDTHVVNRLIVSSYLKVNGLLPGKNLLLKEYVINESNNNEFRSLLAFNELLFALEKKFTLEHLIELFEFVVSPSDKMINGAVYTPKYVREYIVNIVLQAKFREDSFTCADLSCGCGGFLLSAANWLKTKTKKTFKEIYSDHIFGLDITNYSIERAKLLLILNAVEQGEDVRDFTFNLVIANALSFKRNTVFRYVENGFTAILGNPPYVCSRNMDKDSKDLLKNWSVALTGHPDLYIPFFQIAIENLERHGLLGYITVNTFTKSINGRALRTYFSSNNFAISIINFGGEQLFKDRNTYTCICFIEKSEGVVKYTLTKSKEINTLTENSFLKFKYAELDDRTGWNLTNSSSMSSYIKNIESTGVQFHKKYVTRNGIATLKNDVFKFSPKNVADSKYYHFSKGGKDYRVEKDICRDIVNSNKIKTEQDIRLKMEKIIFPYYQGPNGLTIISDSRFKRFYPKAYKYLEVFKDVLAKRDKGEREYEAWYAYGRRQSMDINAFKLFFPHLSEKPSFVICRKKDLLFYNGMAVISDSLVDLMILKKILESDLFLKYISNNTKSYASGYFSLARNYLKNFGIYNFNEEQKRLLLELENPLEINSFLTRLYRPHVSHPTISSIADKLVMEST